MSMLDDDELDLPEAQGSRRRRFSLIWLVPIAAVAVALFLGWRTLSEAGPTITIRFETGEGLEAGQTPVKHKDVTLGEVESVVLSDDLKEVIVSVSMEAEAEDFLGPKTQFWVVRPRIGPSGVSGLGTLVSGAYIAMAPDRGRLTTRFEGLDEPPVLESSEPGTSYILSTDKLVSIGAGSPIFFRGIQVGQILGYEFDDRTQEIKVHAFVRAPHDQLVNRTTRFWNASGVAVSTNGGQLRVEIESLQALFSGGVAFESGVPTTVLSEPAKAPADSAAATAATDSKKTYKLFASKDAADEAGFSHRRRFLLYFTDSVSGLQAGSPVTLQGIKVGEVVSVRLEFDADTNKILVPVLIEVEGQRFAIIGSTLDQVDRRYEEILSDMVDRGLRGQLELSNFLTGAMTVTLAFFPDAAPATLTTGGAYPEIPTKETQLTAITQSATEILNKIARLPLNELIGDLRETVQAYGALATSPEVQDSLKELDDTLASASRLMATTSRDIGPVMTGLRSFLSSGTVTLDRLSGALTTLEPGAPLQRDLRQSMVELRDALRSIRVLADFLESQPDALLRGRINFDQDFAR
ncbi:MAG: MlaD family protein [Rhodospirillales bacterium]